MTIADVFAGLDTAFGERTDEMWGAFQAAATTPAPVEATPVVRCTRCGRRLRKPSATGMGPTCTRKAKTALSTLTDYTDVQIEKAREVIELGAVIRLNAAEFEVIGSKGDHYITDGVRCECLAGENGRRCYHLALVAAVTVAV